MESTQLIDFSQWATFVKSRSERPVPDWKISNNSKKSEYPKGVLHFKNKYSIQTTEGYISSSNEQISIQLLDPHVIARNKKKYTYIHIGLVQVYVVPKMSEGVNGSVSLFLRDKRLLDFNESFLNVPHSTEAYDPINFFPNFMVSVQEIDILHHLKLNVKFHDLNMNANRYPLALTYKIHYKWKRGQMNPEAKSYGPGLDVVLQHTNMRSPNDLTPRVIKRSDIQFPEGWTVQDGIPEEQEHNSIRFIHIYDKRVKLEFPKIHQ